MGAAAVAAKSAFLRAGQPKDIALAIDLLQRAIAFQPLSVHLYDKLIRLYGRRKRYPEIHWLLARGIETARETARRQPRSRQAAKAVHDFEQRARAAAKRATGKAHE
jgi:hypothetical protein